MQQLRLFCDVVAARSFSVAAERHDITQSAVSQRMHSLEQKLGITLIDRSVRPLALTAAGELFHEGAQDILERYDRLTEKLTQLDASPAGTVRVDAIYSAGIDLLNRVKEQLRAAAPGVSVVVEYRQPDEVHDAVRQQRCDLGIVSYPQRWRDVLWLPLRDEVMAVVTGPNHPLTKLESVEASQLEDQPMAIFEADLPVGRHVRRYLREQGVEPRVTSTFDNVDTIKNAVAVTDEVAILPRRTVQQEVAKGTLAVRPLQPALYRPMGVIYRKRSRGAAGVFSPAVQSFVDCLLKHAGPEATREAAAQDSGAEGSPKLAGVVST